MTIKQRIEAIETKLDVQSLTIEKFGKTFQVYPWLKGRGLHTKITGKESMQEKSIGLLFRQIRSVFYGWWNFYRKYDAWAFTNSMERRLVGDKYYDKLFDYLGNNCNRKTLIIENRLFKYYKLKSIASKYAVSKSLFAIVEELYAKIALRRIKVNSKSLLDEIVNEIGVGFDSTKVLRKYLAQYWLMKNWLKIFPNPKVVYLSVSYANYGYIRAFKERGIKVVEFQHGLISKNHHSYFYVKEFNDIQFPDVILTTGERELDVFDSENKFPTSKIVPIGSFILDYYSRQEVKIKRDRTRIIFAMQDGVIGEKFIQFILELKGLITDDVELVIKFRRSSIDDYIQKYPKLIELKIADQDFYSELVHSDIHSTVYSTTAIESLSIGKPNIMVDIDNLASENFNAILGKNEFTHFVKTPFEFLEVINGIKLDQKEKIIASNDKNVKHNYRSNIKTFLNTIDW